MREEGNEGVEDWSEGGLEVRSGVRENWSEGGGE